MKKFISLILALLTVSALMAGCAPASDQLDPAITVASSDAYANAEWLDARLDNVPDDVIVGIGSNETYGIDMSGFEADGYILREMNGQVLAFGASEDGLDRAVRKYAKSVEKGIAENLDEVYHEGKRIGKLTIGGHDISEFTVVYDNSEEMIIPASGGYLTGNAEYAATEAVRLIEIATGTALTMQAEEVSGPMIKIGYLTDGNHDTNGFIYEVKDGNLEIYGVSEGNGCANGVYYFLQYECGWNNLLYGDSVLAESDHVDVPDGTSADVTPMFGEYARPFCGFKYGQFANERAANYLGVRSITSHGVFNYVDGYDWGQNPCYLDEIILEEATEKVLKHVQNIESTVNKEDFKTNIKLYINEIHLGTGDTDEFCLCPNCRKIYNTDGKTHAAAYIQWMNHIAETLEGEGYGGINLNAYAYTGTKKPPTKTVPHKDVKISFCTDGHCFTHGLNSGECCRNPTEGWSIKGHNDNIKDTNQQISSYIKGWSEITENLFVWYYALDNNLNAFSSINTLYEDMKFLQECDVEGLYFQCDYEGIGIARIQYQLIMDMHWNPDMTEEEFEAALCETLEDEYGEGWYYIREYLNIWHEAQIRSGYCKNCWGYSLAYTTGNYDWDFYAEHYDTMYKLFENAIDLADSDENVKWLELLSAHMIAEGSVSSYFTAYENGETERLDVLRDRYAIMVERMLKYGIDPGNLRGQDNWGHGYAYTLDEQAWYGWYNVITMYGMDDAERLPEEIPEEFVITD